MSTDYEILKFVIDSEISLSYNSLATHKFEEQYPQARAVFAYAISLGSIEGTAALYTFKNSWEVSLVAEPSEEDIAIFVALCRWRLMTKFRPPVRYYHSNEAVKKRLDNIFLMLNECEYAKLLLREDTDNFIGIDGRAYRATIIQKWTTNPLFGTPPMEDRGWGYPPRAPEELYYDYVARPTGLEKYEDRDIDELLVLPPEAVLFAPSSDKFSPRFAQVRNGEINLLEALKLNQDDGGFDMGEIIETHLGWGLVNCITIIAHDRWFTGFYETKEEAIAAAKAWYEQSPHNRKVIFRT